VFTDAISSSIGGTVIVAADATALVELADSPLAAAGCGAGITAGFDTTAEPVEGTVGPGELTGVERCMIGYGLAIAVVAVWLAGAGTLDAGGAGAGIGAGAAATG
jgi:hypothetical protein